MKIAQIAPIWFTVPPLDYGGTERVVSFLTEELVRRGHEVTLFAAPGSRTQAKLVCPFSQEEVKQIHAYNDPQFRALNQKISQMVFDQAGDFDIIHSHNADYSFPYADKSLVPVIHTLHNQLPRASKVENQIYRQYRHLNFVSISDSFRTHFDLNYVKTVYHGIPTEIFRFNPAPGGNLFWIGRASKHKGELAAMAAAKASGRNLTMALSLRSDTQGYFDNQIKPRLTSQIRIIENLKYLDTPKLYGESCALLFPIDWEEPFGLVMIEAMSCGTPVIAYNRGSVPEIVKDGVTGFIVEPGDGVAGLVEAIGRISEIDRVACRRHVEQNFTVEKMVDGYENLYQSMVR